MAARSQVGTAAHVGARWNHMAEEWVEVGRESGQGRQTEHT